MSRDESLWTNPFVVSGSTATFIFAGFAWRRRWGKIRTAEYITPKMIDRQRKIVGRCLKVTDADGLRIQHLPALRRIWPGAAPPWKQLSQETISIRLAGIDAPEMAHFGKEAQAHSQEAFDYLKEIALHRKVKLQLLRKDQYGRAVCTVHLRGWLPFYSRSVSLALAKAGFCTLYTATGAEYGSERHRQQLEDAIDRAKSRRIGMWKDGVDAVETPAEFKRRA